MVEKYKKIEYVPKETFDKEKNILYIDHRELVRKETEVEVLSPREFAEMIGKALKNYRSDYILQFNPQNLPKKVHLHHNPLSNRPLEAIC